MIGETLDGKYKLVRLLGEGGMGAVYEARHTQTNRRVAVKIIRGDHDPRKDAERVRRFQREAKAAGSIDTQHIAQVLDAGADAERGIPYITLEYLHGEDFHQLLKRVGVLRPDVALRLVGQACLGIQKAHEARVFHRDIKPANLFLARREEGEVEVKLLDFGIAKMRSQQEGEDTTGLTQNGALLGSPLYMSPEQARSLPEIDGRTDIWSLGVVLYRALAGRAPHEGVTQLGGLIYAICSEPATPIRSIAPWVSADVARVVHQALSIKPEARFQSAAEMLAAIKELVPNGLSVHERDMVALESTERVDRSAAAAGSGELDALRTSQSGAQALSAREPTAGSARGAARRRALWLVGAAGALIVAGTGVYRLVVPAAARSVEAPELKPGSQVAAALMPAPGELRMVTLVVMPRDVSVTVDGVQVVPVDGTVRVQGSLGSIHKVLLSKDGREMASEVIVTEIGPSPPFLELAISPATDQSAAPPGSASAPARPARPAPKPEPQVVDPWGGTRKGHRTYNRFN